MKVAGVRAERVPGAQTKRTYTGVGAAVGATDRTALSTHAEPGALGRRPCGPAGAHQAGAAARACPPPAAGALRAQAARAAAALVARNDPRLGAAHGRGAIL